MTHVKPTELYFYIFIIFIFVCFGCNETQQPEQEQHNEKPILVKSKDLNGLRSEVDDLFSKENNYSATQKCNYRIDLVQEINKYASSNPYECSILLIKLTQYAGAADSESITPSLNEIFLKFPVEAIKAIINSPNYLLKQFNNKEYIDHLYSVVIQFPFYYLETTTAEKATLQIQKDKNRLKKIINDSDLDKIVKNKVENLINEMQL